MRDPSGMENSPEQLRQLSLIQIKALRQQSAKHSERRRMPPLIQQERKSPLPLSFAQERLWFLDQLGLMGAAYNSQMALRLEGVLIVGALERALAELIHRHESLRTRFVLNGGSPMQIVEPPSAFSLGVRD